MKKLKILLCTAVSALLLCACGSKVDEGQVPILPTKEPITSNTGGQATESKSENDNTGSEPTGTIDDTLPPKDGMLRSRLTNEWVEADVANTRPIAVMMPIEEAAMPLYNISKASILYEANAAGGITRTMAIIEDWEGLEKIGNVRSLRLYYGYWATEWDSFIVHFGGPYFIDDFVAEPTTQNINGTSGTGGTAFFRSTDRPAPHNAYTSGEGLLSVINKKGYSLAYRGLADDQHYQFTPKASPNTLDQYPDAVTANTIDMSKCYTSTKSRFEYNADDGLYYRYQHLSGGSDGPQVDGVDGTQLSFKNVLVQTVYSEELGQGYLAVKCHDTTRDGWYFTNGKGIHVKWKKTSDYGATRYYDDNGDEITLNTGKTMVLIVKEGDTFDYE
jgi:hypothetical protein